MKHKLISLLVLISLSYNANAQYEEWGNGKIYLKDGTVLEGLVRFYYVGNSARFSSNEKMRFKTERNKPSKKIAAKNVDSVRFNLVSAKKTRGRISKKKRSVLFVSFPKNKKRMKFGYAEMVTNGRLKMLKRSLSNANNPRMVAISETLFLRVGEVAIPFSQIELKSFKKRAVSYFRDCPGLVDKLEKKQFGRNDLLEIAKFYNVNCQ